MTWKSRLGGAPDGAPGRTARLPIIHELSKVALNSSPPLDRRGKGWCETARASLPSFEPLLSVIPKTVSLTGIHWAIVGGESLDDQVRDRMDTKIGYKPSNDLPKARDGFLLRAMERLQ